MTVVREHGPASSGVRRYIVARTDEIPDGGRLIVEVDGREIGVFNIGGEFHALLNRCPHRSGPLCEGQLLKLVVSPRPGEIHLDPRAILTCPWHNWEFDVKTGQSYLDPVRMRGRQFRVEIESGDVVAQELESNRVEWIPGPYVASVIPTAVDEEYIVVAMRQTITESPSPST